MSLFKKIFLYFPMLLGASMILAFPIGIIFTQAQYGMGTLESVGDTADYFFNGTKLSYMFLIWPLGVLVELPMFLILLSSILIIFFKIWAVGNIPYDQIVAGILGLILSIVVFKLKKNGYLNWFGQHSIRPEFIMNFSILTWTIVSTFFLSYYTGHYILPLISDVFVYHDLGFFSLPQNLVEYVTGLPVTYAFFTGLLFTLFTNKNNWNSHLLALSPVLVLSALGGVGLFFATVGFFTAGFLIAKSINITKALTRT